MPTLLMGDLVIRESIAILAWLDRAFPERPIWGEGAVAAAAVWQDVMLMEADLRPAVTAAAQGLIRGRTVPDGMIDTLNLAADAFDERLSAAPFLGGAAPMAADLWLYPALRWIARGVDLNAAPPAAPRDLVSSRPALVAWDARLAALPGVAATHPPHWRPE